ncbi:hypothetical protein [Ancylobacter rudongensis]|uniref:Uncharacterized protein n=1 Tax=Ancylobacter rudongensis TaxID=177413 RepID=A0A1G4RXI8_9HYPH|nr:hypothetical protein [Ancylobacter rudongensis]SCW61653.1 hypothetical protein SAMN05660859_2017 [Ancylobacter rudongensis]
MGEFWVFENWTHNYIRVHRRNCCMCNNGRGIHTGAPERNGRWHPAETREQALLLAQRLGKTIIAECATCGG